MIRNNEVFLTCDLQLGVPQVSFVGTVTVRNLRKCSSKVKLFADDTSLFSVTFDINTSANELNNVLKIENGKWTSTLNEENRLKKSFLVENCKK